MMNYILYEYSLCCALVLMLFFGIYFIAAKTPNKPIYGTYIRSRRIMGIALLVLSANYSVHILCNIRFSYLHAAILMNLSTYFLSCWLFSSALMVLLDRSYLTRRRSILHIILWLMFTVVSGVILLLMSNGFLKNIGLLIMAIWFFAYGFKLARRLIITYQKAVRLFDDTHSDYIAAYIHWLSIFTYWAVIYGISCGFFTFLPDKYVFLWVLSSIPFYIYLYCSYMNYMLFYEQVEHILETETASEHIEPDAEEKKYRSSYYEDIAKNLNEWILTDGYIHPGLTIEELSDTLKTNRTYLADYIKTYLHVSFRDYITGLRLEYAKRMLIEHPELTINGVSESSGFLSPSYFTKIFKEKEGASPARWRKTQTTDI